MTRRDTPHKGCANSTPHLARVTHANIFSRVAQAELTLRSLHCFVSFLKKKHPHRRIACRTLDAHGLTAYLFFCRTALRLWSTLQTGVPPAIRNKEFSLAVLPMRAHSQVMSPTILWRLAVRRLRLCSYPREIKHWFDVGLEEQEAQMEDRFLSGRQIASMIYEYFEVSGAH